MKYPESWCRFPLNLLVHYLDNPHKLEYVVVDGLFHTDTFSYIYVIYVLEGVIFYLPDSKKTLFNIGILYIHMYGF